MAIRLPRGTNDILPDEQPYWDFVTTTAARVARQFCYQQVETPMFESTDLFVRGVGSETDIVQKEMYTFEDHSGDSLTLRPEGTAGVCRAYIQHGMQNQPQPVRLYYVVAMFRYERPQAGRLRQHHQFGVEAIGDGSPHVDAEVIELALRFLSGLGMRGLTVKLNSIGDGDCRPEYLDVLRSYFLPHTDRLSVLDRGRLQRSPLRLLDSKDPYMLELGADAPRSVDYLDDACREHWNETLAHMEDLKPLYPDFQFQTDHRLVRGLDYYTRTVFEIHPRQEGAQSSVLSGGRYDGLIEELGGPPTPGVGFGSGIERHILNLKRQETGPAGHLSHPEVVVVHIGPEVRRPAVALTSKLRGEGLAAVMAPDRSMRGQMRYAGGLSATYALIVGARELERGVVSLKSLGGGDQTEVPLDPVSIAEAVRGD